MSSESEHAGGDGGQGAHARESTVVGDLDMARREDRAALARGVAAGWSIDEEQLQRYRRALDVALGIALKSQNVRHIVSCVRAMQVIVGQVQVDEARQQPGSEGIEVVIRYADDADSR